jgi:hypothetical protein
VLQQPDGEGRVSPAAARHPSRAQVKRATPLTQSEGRVSGG